ncbi:Frag1/DRAM/Sfk1 [Phlyctochytrium arcticum]|nr:Frag1/DRAM/Sfk1 [Phlyctochytrium arcticum]
MGLYLAWGILPFIAGLAWTALITAVLILWLATDTPHYKQDDATIVYISDVGAKYRTLFIIGTSITSFFFVMTLLVDLTLRHRGRLPQHFQLRETIDAVLSLLFGAIAAACLVLLSVYDAFQYNRAHWAFTLGFMACTALSAIFKVAELRRLRKEHFGIVRLWKSYTFKLTIVLFAIAIAVAMIVLMNVCTQDPNVPGKCDGVHSAAAVCEWVAGYLIGIYYFSLIRDLRAGYIHHNSTVAMEAGSSAWRGNSAATLPMPNPYQQRAYY